MTGELEKNVLKGASRSFYLTLRLLPRPMRGAASIGYLLARTSDTLADSAAVPLDERLHHLDRFRIAVAGKSPAPLWSASLLKAIPDPREQLLLARSGAIFHQLECIPDAEAELVREVLRIIASGQTLDLEHFADASYDHPVALENDAELEDYAWRVAGCVGAFWTKLGFLTLGDAFSTSSESALLAQGIAYGKGLQLVNILRDLAADLATGRCYLPVSDPRDPQALLDAHARWWTRASGWVGEGENYARSLPSRRLRTATILPARIAMKTLESLRGASWQALQSRIKIPRKMVYQCLIRAFLDCRA